MMNAAKKPLTAEHRDECNSTGAGEGNALAGAAGETLDLPRPVQAAAASAMATKRTRIGMEASWTAVDKRASTRATALMPGVSLGAHAPPRQLHRMRRTLVTRSGGCVRVICNDFHLGRPRGSLRVRS